MNRVPSTLTLVFDNAARCRYELSQALVLVSNRDETLINFQGVVHVRSRSGTKIRPEVIKDSRFEKSNGDREGEVTLEFESVEGARRLFEYRRNFIQKYDYRRCLVLTGYFEVVYVGGTVVDPSSVCDAEKVLV